MAEVKSAVKSAAIVLAVIFVANQISVTRTLVQRALNG